MCPSHFCQGRVESESQVLRVRIESESFKNLLNRVKVRVMAWSSRVTITVTSLRVIGLQARVNVEPQEISHFFLRHFFAMKLCPTCHKIAPDKLENGAQYPMKRCPIS